MKIATEVASRTDMGQSLVEQYDEFMVKAGRLAALKAFHAEVTPGSSSMSYFAGQKPPKKCQTKPKKWEVPAPGDRSEWAQAQRARILRRRLGYEEIHATATRAPGFSRPPIPERQILAGSIRKAISELDMLDQLWINFCYRAPGVARNEYGENFHRRFFTQYAKHNLFHAKSKTRENVKHLVAVAMANEAEPNRTIYPEVEDEDKRAWNKTYRPHFFQIRVDLAEVDQRALFTIAEKLAKTAL